jgi:predicted negative regulator of RcsB-dependent stress response
MDIINNIKQTYTQNRRLIIWVVCLIALAVILWFIFRKVKTSDQHKEEIKKLEERNKYLESQNYKDSLYRVDTVEVEITKTNERIIYNTKVYEKIIHKYDTATAIEHEKYYRTRYGQDTSTNER